MTQPPSPVRVRIAPSPTGDPHVGTAYAALFNLALARKTGGKFLLRIEDTDRARSSQENEEKIYEALHWLGLQWDEGPDVGGPFAPYRQSERKEIYRRYADELSSRRSAYWCFCTPERLETMRQLQQASGKPTRYDGHCRNLPFDEQRRLEASSVPRVLRLQIPAEGETSFEDLVRGRIVHKNTELDDTILLKSDGFPTYHLANVVDDHLMEITHVLRAEEWIPSTPRHILIYQGFGWTPPQFAHFPLLRNSDRTKISKRKNPTSLLYYREQGYLPEALLNFLALQGLSPPDNQEIFCFDVLRDSFGFDRILTTGPVFNIEKLDWMNGEYIRALSVEELTRRLREYRADIPREPALEKIVPLVRDRIKKLSDFSPLTEFFYRDPENYDPALLLQKSRTLDEVQKLFSRFASEIEHLAHSKIPDMPIEHVSGGYPIPESSSSDQSHEDVTVLDRKARDVAQEFGWKVGEVFMTLRVAITGKTATPPLCESMVVLGWETVLRRLKRAAERLS